MQSVTVLFIGLYIINLLNINLNQILKQAPYTNDVGQRSETIILILFLTETKI